LLTIDIVKWGNDQMFRRAITTGLAIQLLLVSYCAAQAVDPGPIRVGDRWSYDIKDALTGDLRQAVTIIAAEINEKEITTRISVRGRDRPLTFVFDLDWGRVDDGVWKHRPSDLLGIKKPLQVGKQWRAEGNSANLQTGVALQTSALAKVVGQEQITTPAGTFDTFRVELTVRQINTKDQTKSSTLNTVTWYAPAINRWVKRQTEVRFEGRLRDSLYDELTEYGRRP
jgi:uncharacterized protein DUF3108